MTETIPKLANCGRYLAQTNDGRWHYLNHAESWHSYQGPTPNQDIIRNAALDVMLCTDSVEAIRIIDAAFAKLTAPTHHHANHRGGEE